MRKQLKQKRRSCALCKPHKVGWAKRWSAKDSMSLKVFERERREFIQYQEFSAHN